VEAASSGLPLSGIQVLDLSRLIPGGVATLALADLGADVIKVELPPGGDHLRSYQPLGPDGMGALFHALNRDKRSVVLDYRIDEGRTRLLELARRADVLVEGFRPATMARYRLDYESIASDLPHLVYVSITGYGQSSGFGDIPSHGLNMDAAAGAAGVTDGPGGDVIAQLQPGLPKSVLMGGIQAALGICAALVRVRERGTGCHIDVSCWDAALASDPWRAYSALNGLKLEPFRASSASPKLAAYRTADRKAVVLAPIEPHLWERFCAVVGRPDLLPAPSSAEWDRGSEDLYPEVQRIIETRTLDEWLALLGEAGVPASPLYRIDEALASREAAERGLVSADEDSGQAYANHPLEWLDGHGRRHRHTRAPNLGEHTAEVLGE
jgi:alpha-methylacyl-CoA racemase